MIKKINQKLGDTGAALFCASYTVFMGTAYLLGWWSWN